MDYILNESRNEQNMNLELKPLRGYYVMCFRLK